MSSSLLEECFTAQNVRICVCVHAHKYTCMYTYISVYICVYLISERHHFFPAAFPAEEEMPVPAVIV